MDIFTFLNSYNEKSGYIQLCIESWRKFLPNCKINFINSEKLHKFFNKENYDAILFETFTPHKQLEAVKCSVLKDYGGIWIDCDSVITTSKIQQFIEGSKLTIFNSMTNFIFADKNSEVLLQWQDSIKNRINIYKEINKQGDLISRNINKVQKWEVLTENFFEKDLKDVKNYREINPLLEQEFYKESDLFKTEKYLEFYFNNTFECNYPPIIYLHDLWTPERIKLMSREEILNLDNTLALIFRKILN